MAPLLFNPLRYVPTSKAKFLVISELLRASFWFLPAVMVVAAIVLAEALVSIDRLVLEKFETAVAWSYTGGPEGARTLLSTIAGSMITVAGVVFSITIVSLTLASSQFGPRLLRSFIRDRGNQVVLGTFIATFIYCVLVLRTVRNDNVGGFVPGISVLVGVTLALMSLAVLIYSIHHSATSIQATQVVTAVTAELLRTIDEIYPAGLGTEEPARAEPEPSLDLFRDASELREIRASASGYIMALDTSELIRRTQSANVVVRLLHRPGQFTVQGDIIAQAFPRAAVDEELARSIESVFSFGGERTAIQDVEFGVDQLVEVAVRALSPGINDPFTAMTCVDRLGEALCRLAQRVFPSPFRYDDEGHLRVLAYPVVFGDILDEAFDQIRQYGRTSTAVIIRQLEALRRIAANVSRPQDLAAVRRQADLVAQAGLSGIPDAADREDVEKRRGTVEVALERAGSHLKLLQERA